MILESISGGLVGGVLRLVPELIKAFDRKDERKHELLMLEAEMRFTELRGNIALKQTEAQLMSSEMNAVAVAIQEQGETARAAGKFVAAISALVRPVVTYWFVGMYSATKVAGMVRAFQMGGDWKAMLESSWTEADMGILSLILTFYFVGRVWDDRRRNS